MASTGADGCAQPYIAAAGISVPMRLRVRHSARHALFKNVFRKDDMIMKSRWVVTCTTAMMALAVTAAIPTAARAQKADEAQKPVAEAHMKFNDNDRQVTRTWYDGNQAKLPTGLRDTDRMAPATESQFKEGYVINKDTRKDVHAVPSTLLKLLAPAPHNYRYVAYDGYVALIDSDYKVADVMSVRHDK
jgi:hypothetical protein